jgi:hypothetical protein
MIYSDKNQKRFKKALKLLRKIGIDGESTEELIHQLGMGNQMLRQLLMGSDIQDVHQLLVEYQALNGFELDEVRTLKYRLLMVLDDTKIIEEFLKERDLLAEPTSVCEHVSIIISNIEITCDLNSNECLDWTRFSDIVAEPKKEENARGKYSYHSIDGSNLSMIRFAEECDLDENTFDEVDHIIGIHNDTYTWTLHKDVVDGLITQFLMDLSDSEEYFEYCAFQGTCHVVCSGSPINYNCTPFWEGTNGVPIEVMCDDRQVYFDVVHFDEILNIDHLNDFYAFYTDLVKRLIKMM